MRSVTLEQALLELQSCLCSALDEAVADPDSLAQPVCLCSVVAGDSVPLDYCGPGGCSGSGCGMAWVRLVGIQAAEMEISVPGCAQPLQALIEVGIARCSITLIDDQVNLPDYEDHLRETLIQLDDIRILRKAAGCCTGIKTQIMDYAPFGPEGGCIGGIMNVTVDIT